jgi:4-phospho-D-threonate 3-dehydrogenase / 4-phospho-D-erythronate 3-dehydrogenase
MGRSKSKPLIGMTMGDPAGIGPELLVKFFTSPKRPRGADFVVLGESRYLLHESVHLHRPVEIEICTRPLSRPTQRRGVIPVIETARRPGKVVNYGEVSAAAGAAAARCIELAVEMTWNGEFDAMVTCPIQKESLNLAGYPFPGHTEMIADRCGIGEVSLMLIHGNLRIVHLSNHVALSKACRLVHRERILRTLQLVRETGRRLGISEPRIAVAALNPHAGENGLFGEEEIRQIIPAVEQARKQGIRAEGPFPADSIFPKCACGEYDFVLAMHHDQGHIPFKLLGFRWSQRAHAWSSVRGVNVTLGLPIIRTSVDHGTAFDIVGNGVASTASLEDAVRLAIRLARSHSRQTTWMSSSFPP